VVPAPPGLVTPGEAAVRAFLDRARLALEEALDLFDGAAEMRLHVRRHPVRRDTDPPETAAPTDAEAARAAEGLYHRLRRHARAAQRLEPAAGDLLTAAFLVPRAGWSEGTGLVTRWGESEPGLLARLTGPWAPYDFVRMFPEGPAEASREAGGPARPPEEGGDE
jgi:predicted nucleic acid-binding protein